MPRLSQLVALPTKVAKRVVRHGPADTWHWLWSHVESSRREKRLGIDTTGVIEANELGYSDDAPGYDPISYACMDAVISDLKIEPNKEVFVDIGSGRGRAVIMAAMQPFRRVVGIELHDGLYRDSLIQLEKAKPFFRCSDVAIEKADATTFEYPDDMSVVFLWNPFTGEILDQVMERVRISHERRPRPMALVYSQPLDEIDTLKSRPWLTNRREIPVRFWTGIRIVRYDIDSSK